MALYAIGDLHLSLGADKPMDVFGGPWENYVEKIKLGFSSLHDDDVCVLCGDLAWGMTMEQALPDFQFIEALPGKKILLKGNHDFWWSTAKKAYSFLQRTICTPWISSIITAISTAIMPSAARALVL